MASPSSAHPYCVEAVDRWIRQWDLLTSLAESPRTSLHHLAFDHAGHHGPCAEHQRGSGGRRMDALCFADVVADLESATARLPAGSLERLVVDERVARGGSIGGIAARLHRRKADVCAAYHAALALMAGSLGADVEAS